MARGAPCIRLHRSTLGCAASSPAPAVRCVAGRPHPVCSLGTFTVVPHILISEAHFVATARYRALQLQWGARRPGRDPGPTRMAGAGDKLGMDSGCIEVAVRVRRTGALKGPDRTGPSLGFGDHPGGMNILIDSRSVGVIGQGAAAQHLRARTRAARRAAQRAAANLPTPHTNEARPAPRTPPAPHAGAAPERARAGRRLPLVRVV